MSVPPSSFRVRPGIAAGIAVWLAYTVVVNAVQIASGIPYAEWFATADNAWRTGVLSLTAGSILLLIIVRFYGWKDAWSDPQRLKTTPLMNMVMLFFWAGILLRLAGLRWAEVPGDLLLAILCAGILVGFAEETLFRVLFLRALREGGRSEAAAAIGTAVCFGLFHLPNVFMGTGPIGLVQVFIAGLTGSVLYLFRRRFGTVWPAMVSHGVWDISTFLSASYSVEWLTIVSFVMLAVQVVLGVIVLVSIYRKDRETVLFPVTAP